MTVNLTEREHSNYTLDAFGRRIEALERSIQTIEGPQLADDSVDAGAIAPDAVGMSEIAPDSVSYVEVLDNTLRLMNLEKELSWSVSSSWYTDFSAVGRWNVISGSLPSIQSVANAASGGSVIRATGKAELEWPDNIPFDPTVLYRVSFRVRRTNAETTGAASVFAGVNGIGADGATRVNIAGANSTSSQHMIAANSDKPGVSSTWTTYVGYIKGVASTGIGTKRADPTDPAPLHQDVRYFRPAFTINFDAPSNATYEVDMMAVEVLEFPDGIVTAAKVKVGTLTGDRMFAGTLTARELSAGAATVEKLTVASLGDEMIRNYSFEEIDGSGLPTGWYLTEGTGTFSAPTDTSAPDGDRRLQIDAGDKGVGCLAFPITPGKKYAVRVRLKHTNGTGNVSVRMNERSDVPAADINGNRWIGSSNRDSTTNLINAESALNFQGAWVQRDLVYTAPAGQYWSTLSFINGNSSTGELHVDDVHVREQKGAVEIADGVVSATHFVATMTITGKVIQTATSGSRAVLSGNDNTMRFYNSAGTQTILLDGNGAVIETATINGSTITGSTVQTSASNPATRMSSLSGLRGYASDGTVLWQLNHSDGLTLKMGNLSGRRVDWKLDPTSGSPVASLYAQSGSGSSSASLANYGESGNTGAFVYISANRYGVNEWTQLYAKSDGLRELVVQNHDGTTTRTTTLMNSGGDMNVSNWLRAQHLYSYGDITSAGIVQPTGYVYPGRTDLAGAQGSWALGSHGSYGLWTNTGMYFSERTYHNSLTMQTGQELRMIGDAYIRFPQGGENNYLQENWGIRAYAHDGNHPFAVQRSLLVGTWPAGADFGSGWIYYDNLFDYSDARSKSNIERIGNRGQQRKKVRALSPVAYDRGGERRFGFVAQEVEGVIPEATKRVIAIRPEDVPAEAGQEGLADRRYAREHVFLNHMTITATLTAAVQEQDEEIDSHAALLEEMRVELAMILDRIERLEANPGRIK